MTGLEAIFGPKLYRLRQEAEKLLVDTVQVTRRGGFRIDPATSEEVPVAEAVYTGPAALGSVTLNSSKAGSTNGMQVQLVKFPVGSFQAQDGDVVTWQSSFDPKVQVGMKMRLTGELPSSSIAILYRVIAERLVGHAAG